MGIPNFQIIDHGGGRVCNFDNLSLEGSLAVTFGDPRVPPGMCSPLGGSARGDSVGPFSLPMFENSIRFYYS